MAEHPVRKHGAADQMQKRQYKQCQQTEQRHIQPANPLHGGEDKALDDSLRKARTGKACSTHLRAGGQHIQKQPRHGRGQRGGLPEITAAHSAERRGQQQDQHVQQPGHLMPAADDKTAHTTRCRIEKFAAGRQLIGKAERKRQPGVQHGQRKVWQVVHGTVEPVQSLHGGGHTLDKGEGQQQRQCPGQTPLRRVQTQGHAPCQPIQAEKQRQQHADQRDTIISVAEDGGLKRQRKAGNVESLPVLIVVDVGVPRGPQQTRQVKAVLLHHGMGAGCVDEVICRGARKDRQHQHGQQQHARQQRKAAQPALLRRCIVPKIHRIVFLTVFVMRRPGSSAGSRPTASPTSTSRGRHPGPRCPRWDGCPCSREWPAAPSWRPAGQLPTRPGRST